MPSTPVVDSGGAPSRCPSVGARTVLVRALTAVGLVGYNWWIPVAVHGGLLTTPDELFSDLEAEGRPWAGVLSATDVVSGLVLLVALLVRGPVGRDGHRRSEWPLMLVFAVAGIVGGAFPYVCAEGLSATCRAAEWRLELPWRHYVHVIAGIVEFGSVSLATLQLSRRTARRPSPEASAARPVASGPWAVGAVRSAAVGLVIGYPLLAVTYLTDRWGAFVEPIFFVSFSLVVAVELLEP